MVTTPSLLFFYCSSFNKQEEDFANLREYNDYLEEIETISKYYEANKAKKKIFVCNFHEKIRRVDAHFFVT